MPVIARSLKGNVVPIGIPKETICKHNRYMILTDCAQYLDGRGRPAWAGLPPNDYPWGYLGNPAFIYYLYA
jgi:hypothetical protein